MFGPDTCEGQPEHPELVELSKMEGKQNKTQKYQGAESLNVFKMQMLSTYRKYEY